MKKILVYMLAFVAQTAFAIAPDQVCFYEHSNYTGQNFCVTRGDVGSSFVKMPSGWDNRASSIKTGEYVNVEVFEHENFNGLAMIFEGDHTWLNQAENQISSYKIQSRGNPGFCIFEHFNLTGKRHCRSHDGTDFTINLTDMGFNDQASSIYVQAAATPISIIGYEHIDRLGQSWNISSTNLKFSFDNILSSIMVSAAPKICVYEHNDYRGQQWCMRYTSSDISIPSITGPWNDYISSISIPSGFKLTAYRDANYQNKIGDFTENISRLDGNNDTITSFVISRNTDPVTPPPQPVTPEDELGTVTWGYTNGNQYTFYWRAENIAEGAAIIGDTTSSSQVPRVDTRNQWVMMVDGSIQSKHDRSYCVGLGGQGLTGSAKLYKCTGAADQKWFIDTTRQEPNIRYFLHTSLDYEYCAGGYGVNPVNTLKDCDDMSIENKFFKRSVISGYQPVVYNVRDHAPTQTELTNKVNSIDFLKWFFRKPKSTLLINLEDGYWVPSINLPLKTDLISWGSVVKIKTNAVWDTKWNNGNVLLRDKVYKATFNTQEWILTEE